MTEVTSEEWEQYFALERRLKETQEPVDPYWLAEYIDPKPIILEVARPDYSHLSLAGCIYDALYEASIKAAKDQIKKSQRLSNLSRLFAFLTYDQMAEPEKRHLEQRADNPIFPYSKETIEIDPSFKEDLEWFQRKFDFKIKLLEEKSGK